MVPPDKFIPVAEEIGLIVPLGDWVLKQACRDAVKWPEKLTVAVNLSAVQFRSPTLALSVMSALGQSGLKASRLELEITESVLLQENRAVLDALHQFRKLGVRICMDDFGTGYSSLSYLRSFPFDKIKIDRSFIRELGKESDCVGHHPCRHAARLQPGHDHHGRGRRDRAAARYPALGRLHAGAGLSVQPAEACLRNPGHAAANPPALPRGVARPPTGSGLRVAAKMVWQISPLALPLRSAALYPS